MKTNLRERSTRYRCFIRPKVHFALEFSFKCQACNSKRKRCPFWAYSPVENHSLNTQMTFELVWILVRFPAVQSPWNIFCIKVDLWSVSLACVGKYHSRYWQISQSDVSGISSIDRTVLHLRQNRYWTVFWMNHFVYLPVRESKERDLCEACVVKWIERIMESSKLFIVYNVIMDFGAYRLLWQADSNIQW